MSQLEKVGGHQYQSGSAQVWGGTVAANGILILAWTFSWLWFALFAWSLVILAWCPSLGERCATLVSYWIASRIILSVKVKCLGVAFVPMVG
jgi:hypothetical protein